MTKREDESLRILRDAMTARVTGFDRCVSSLDSSASVGLCECGSHAVYRVWPIGWGNNSTDMCVDCANREDDERRIARAIRLSQPVTRATGAG